MSALREDYAEVHKLQDEFKLVPLSSHGKPYRPPAGTVDPSIDMKTAVRRRLLRDPDRTFGPCDMMSVFEGQCVHRLPSLRGI